VVLIPAAVVININNGQTNDAIARQYQIDQSAKTYEGGARDLQVGMDLYLRGKKELGKQLIDEGTTLMATSREQLKANAVGSSQLDSISETQAIEVKVLEVSNEAIAIADGNASNRDALIVQRRATLDARIEALNLRLSYFADQASEDLDLTIHQSKQTTQQTLLVSFTAAFLICIVLALFMADKLTKPIINLMKIADKVSLGQLQQEVPVSGNDEIADLGSSFKRMINAFKIQQAMYAEDAEGGNHEPV
jgi:nitrogen fixation/metabolism regulation signal transduction histidine kinase